MEENSQELKAAWDWLEQKTRNEGRPYSDFYLSDFYLSRHSDIGILAEYAAHVTAEKDKEIEQLRAEITRLRAAQSGFMQVGLLGEDDYEEIVTAATLKMKKFASGARGQMITVQDCLDWWVMKETERRIRALAEQASSDE